MVVPSGEGFFAKGGLFGRFAVGGEVFRLKDFLGLSFIAYLLLHPGAEFHALDLGDRGSRPYVASCMAVGVPPHISGVTVRIGRARALGELRDCLGRHFT
jgi:hypothetical protein